MTSEPPSIIFKAAPEIPLIVRESGRAKNILVRINSRSRSVELVLPQGCNRQDGLRFVEEKRQWIERHLADLPRAIALSDGAWIRFRDVPHQIVHKDRRRGTVEVKDRQIIVYGDGSHLRRRLQEWLRTEARADFSRRCRGFADQLDVTFTRITVRDTQSRWGSCSAEGRLSFSWRLIMAPDWVADYVCAHEVAHLIEMNHSQRFWRIVKRLSPTYTRAEHWLTKNAALLHAVA